MNITKSTYHVLFEIQQEDYFYWETFCDSFIERCTKIIAGKQGTEKMIHSFQEFKECLDLILFIVDISKQDKVCTVQIPTGFLSLIKSLMEKWEETLQYELQQVKLNQTKTNNGENKRQLFEKQGQLEQVLQVNTRVIRSIKEYQEG